MNPTDVLINLLTGVVGLLIGVPLGTWIVQKRLFSPQNLMEMADSLMDYAVNTLEGQQKISKFTQMMTGSIGKSFGVPSRGGKMGIKDIAIQIALGYAQQHGLIPGFAPQPQNNQQEQGNPALTDGNKPFG